MRLRSEGKITDGAQAFFVYLLEYASADGTCGHALATICAKIAKRERMVRYYAAALAEVGLIRVTKTAGRYGRRIFEVIGAAEAEQPAADRRAPEPPLNPGRETGSADRQAEHPRPAASRWRNAPAPGRNGEPSERNASTSRPAPAETFIPREAAIFPALVAKLARFTNRRIDPLALGLHFAPAWIEAARAALEAG
ncbi:MULTISPECIES: hypothetical protein [Methylosinus]|nr:MULTISPECIES: hypothetical protein [Methylosinus]